MLSSLDEFACLIHMPSSYSQFKCLIYPVHLLSSPVLIHTCCVNMLSRMVYGRYWCKSICSFHHQFAWNPMKPNEMRTTSRLIACIFYHAPSLHLTAHLRRLLPGDQAHLLVSAKSRYFDSPFLDLIKLIDRFHEIEIQWSSTVGYKL